MPDDFTLWLEFENWDRRDTDDSDADSFYMQITLPDGTLYSLEVWTYRFAERAAEQCGRLGKNLQGTYLFPPDLLIARCWDRQLCEEVVADLIAKNALNDAWIITDDDP